MTEIDNVISYITKKLNKENENIVYEGFYSINDRRIQLNKIEYKNNEAIAWTGYGYELTEFIQKYWHIVDRSKKYKVMIMAYILGAK